MSEPGIFPKGERLSNEHFTGEAWLQMLVDDDSVFNCPMGYVTFAPGARNHWHKHPGGQLLLVISGVGYYQEKGKQALVLHKGDVVKIPPNVEHWHGATLDSGFSHIAVGTNPRVGAAAEWLHPVSDEDYNACKGE